MIDHDDRHWWYRGRRRVLRAQLARIGLPAGARILDAGCGSGRTLDELARLGTACGVDISPAAVAAARLRGHADVRVASVEDLPFPDDRFDLVTCLDVVEHTDDDRATLRELRRVTRPGGVLLMTVPAYPGLWSRHDVRNGHRRRYTAPTARAAAAEAGWTVLRTGHFNSVLLPPAAAVRLAERGRDPRGRSDLALTPRSLDSVLELPLRLEAGLIRRGVRLPAGLSLLLALANLPASEPAPSAPGPRERPLAALAG